MMHQHTQVTGLINTLAEQSEHVQTFVGVKPICPSCQRVAAWLFGRDDQLDRTLLTRIRKAHATMAVGQSRGQNRMAGDHSLDSRAQAHRVDRGA